MENPQTRSKRLIETIILVIVLMCTALVLTDLTGNVVNEINAGRPTVTQEIAPLILPPGVTPSPFLIGG